MRYKFRGKRSDGQGWVYGDLLNRRIWSRRIPIIRMVDDGFDTYQEAQVTTDSVGQWTGKFDINGVEVYQGDIVNSGHLKADEWIPSIAVIEWDEDFAMFRQVLKGVNEGLEQLMDVPCEVIGNVIDSPELIEVK